MNVPARLVAEGGGLPPVFCWGMLDGRPQFTTYDNGGPAGLPLVLTDPQTAFGVALQLDAWERERDPEWGWYGRLTWAERAALAEPDPCWWVPAWQAEVLACFEERLAQEAQ